MIKDLVMLFPLKKKYKFAIFENFTTITRNPVKEFWAMFILLEKRTVNISNT